MKTTKPNLRKRTFAALLDYGLFYTATFVYISYFGELTGEGEYTISGLPALIIPICWLIYFVIIETINEATLGHQAFNLSVKSIDRKPITLSQSLKRHLMDPIDIFIFGIPARITILNTERHQRVGDLWAKTIVVDLEDREQI